MRVCVCVCVWTQYIQAVLSKDLENHEKLTAGGQSSCYWWLANEEASNKSWKRTCWQFLGASMRSWNVKQISE